VREDLVQANASMMKAMLCISAPYRGDTARKRLLALL
jgi:hypothetical protein